MHCVNEASVRIYPDAHVRSSNSFPAESRTNPHVLRSSLTPTNASVLYKSTCTRCPMLRLSPSKDQKKSARIYYSKSRSDELKIELVRGAAVFQYKFTFIYFYYFYLEFLFLVPLFHPPVPSAARSSFSRRPASTRYTQFCSSAPTGSRNSIGQFFFFSSVRIHRVRGRERRVRRCNAFHERRRFSLSIDSRRSLSVGIPIREPVLPVCLLCQGAPNGGLYICIEVYVFIGIEEVFARKPRSQPEWVLHISYFDNAGSEPGRRRENYWPKIDRGYCNIAVDYGRDGRYLFSCDCQLFDKIFSSSPYKKIRLS